MEYLVDLSTLALTIVMVGFLTETLVELFKTYFPKIKEEGSSTIHIISMTVSIILCIALGISLFESTNLFAYWVGTIFCGLIASRGSNYVHNWLDILPRKIRK